MARCRFCDYSYETESFFFSGLIDSDIRRELKYDPLIEDYVCETCNADVQDTLAEFEEDDDVSR